LKTPHCPTVPQRGPEAGDPPEIAWFNDFHGSGANTLFMPVSPEPEFAKEGMSIFTS